MVLSWGEGSVVIVSNRQTLHKVVSFWERRCQLVGVVIGTLERRRSVLYRPVPLFLCSVPLWRRLFNLDFVEKGG